MFLRILGLGVALMGTVWAAPKTFDFKDPKGVNAVSIFLDSELEPIVGMATDIAGSLRFDPNAPKSTSGKIHFPTTSIELSNSKMTSIMEGKSWLDAKSFGDVAFEIKEVRSVKSEGGRWLLDTLGHLSLKGVSLPLEVQLDLSLISGGAEQRGKGQGDLLVLRADFSISRGAFGIKPGENLNKVGDRIDIKVAIAGYPKD